MRAPPGRRRAEPAAEIEPPLLRVRRPTRWGDGELVEAAMVEGTRERPTGDGDLLDRRGQGIADVDWDQRVRPHEIDRIEAEKHGADRRLDDRERGRTADLGTQLEEVGCGIVEQIAEERPQRAVLEDEQWAV